LKQFERILVIKLRQLGDVLLTTPVFRALKESFPGSSVTACVPAGSESILVGNNAVDEILGLPAIQEKDTLFSRWQKELAFGLRLRRKRFDLVIDLTTSDRSAIITALSGAKTRLGYVSYKGFLGRNRCYTESVRATKEQHIVRKHLQILETLGIRGKDYPLEFPINEEDRTSLAALLPPGQPFVQVHPVSRIAEKNWPSAFMAETVRQIARRGLMPVITGSSDPKEQGWLNEFKAALQIPHIDASGKLNLKQLGALSERAKFYLGVDTAPMHIAAAVGTPVVALFGPSSEQFWAPWCDQSLVLSRELDCRLPCKNKECQTVHCLREFTPAMVLPKIEEFLATL
jgi:heptosyltransferase-3